MRTYNVGIIGCGRMAWLFDEDKLVNKPVSHIGAYSLNPQTKVIAVCDINREKLNKISKKFNIKNIYFDYRKMLKDQRLDIVSICTPPAFHSDICIAAAESGVKAVFCEKPIATSVTEAENMSNSCRKNKVKLIINHTRRWDSSYSAIRDILNRGILGRINTVHAFATVGLLNSGTHLFDLLRWYFGDVKSVSGSIINDKSSDPGGMGVIEFSEGILCYVDSQWREYVLFGVDMYGEKGMLRACGQVRSKEVFELLLGKKSKNESGIKELGHVNYKLPKWTPPMLNAVENIINSLEKGEKILCTGEDGKASLEIALAFHKSSCQNGKKVELPLCDKALKVIPRETSFTRDGKFK